MISTHSNSKSFKIFYLFRLENGLEKLRVTASQVNELKAQLATQEIELTKKNEEADKLIEIVGIETEKVSKEKASADEEEQNVNEIARYSSYI